MKKIVCSFLFLAIFAQLLWAQGAKKYVLLEHFTNSRCGICAFRNPDFHDLIKDYPDDVHHISFHPSNPYPNCVFHQANPVENNSRANYYGIFGTPVVFMLGEQVQGSDLLTQSQLEGQLMQTSPIALVLNQTPDGQNVAVELTVEALESVSAGNYRLYVAAVEKEIDQTTPNGEDVHYNVFRQFLTNAEGDMIALPDAGMSTNYSYDYTLDDAWVADEMYVLAWIQNMDNDEVLNSGSSLDVTITATEDIQQELITQVFPNPTQDYLQIQLENTSTAQGRLYDLTGRNLQSFTFAQNTRLDLTSLPSGVYLLEVRTGEGVATRRILKK